MPQEFPGTIQIVPNSRKGRLRHSSRRSCGHDRLVAEASRDLRGLRPDCARAIQHGACGLAGRRGVRRPVSHADSAVMKLKELLAV